MNRCKSKNSEVNLSIQRFLEVVKRTFGTRKISVAMESRHFPMETSTKENTTWVKRMAKESSNGPMGTFTTDSG